MQSVSDRSEADFTVIKYLINRGDHIVDLGANMGFYTKYLSELVGSNGKVHSIEPIPTTFELLKFIVKKLKMDNVSLMNYAISNVEGNATMEIPVYEDGEENYFEARVIEHPTIASLNTTSVRLTTLDILFSHSKHYIAFIKCDVEGHELKCVLGAKKIIKQMKPSWLVEIWGDLDDTSSEGYKTVSQFETLGYKAFWFDKQHLRRRNRGEKSINYFFFMEHHLRSLNEKNRDLLEPGLRAEIMESNFSSGKPH
jgi:FkbM family methyltransferase